MEQTSKPARKVAIADHIWDAFEEMAQQMGSDRDGLINQAMFMFARLNGFMDANGAAAPKNGAAPAARAAPAPRPGPPVLAPVSNKPDPAPAQSAAAARAAKVEAQRGTDEDPQRREVAERVLETAAELERLIKGKNQPPPPQIEEDQPVDELDENLGMDVSEEEPAPEEEPEEEPAEEGGLYLMNETGDLDRVAKERFVIGRGKHCDFVINSGKVSREHAAITHEGDEWYIEDLGSSNGTWFNKQRIKRRKVEDGDEYFICSEKIKLVFR